MDAVDVYEMNEGSRKRERPRLQLTRQARTGSCVDRNRNIKYAYYRPWFSPLYTYTCATFCLKHQTRIFQMDLQGNTKDASF